MAKKKSEVVSETPYPDPDAGTVICVVTEPMGGNYVKAICMDGKERKLRIPGKLRHKVWINVKDVVLVGKWEFDEGRGDILYKYGRDEKKKLIEAGFLDPSLAESAGEF
ncbi:MAG: translation initiation factor aIF-1A [Desulfurococcaceae archaeon TW002]